MRIFTAVVLLAIGSSVAALAVITPEIDPASAGSALALLAGALVILQGRRKR